MKDTTKAPVFCFECAKKSRIEIAVKLVPVREGYYDLSGAGGKIDDRKVALCKKCYDEKNDFQRKNCDRIHPYNKPILTHL